MARGAPLSELDRRLLRQLFHFGPSTLLTAAVSAVTIGGVFFALTGRTAALLWVVGILAMLGLRLALMRANARAYPEPAHAQGQPGGAWRYLAPLPLYAALWGAAPWLLLPRSGGRVELDMLLILGLFSVMAGSVPIIAGWRAVVWLWLVPVSGGIALFFALHGGEIGRFACACALIFGAAMARFALSQHALLRRSLAAQIEKDQLSERLIAQSRDLERLNQERSRFFAAASHDLRQPVHALALFSESLRRDLHGHPSLPVAEQVVQATKSVSHLLNAMLDISKIDAGAVQANPAPVAVERLFLHLQQLFESRAAAAGFELRFHLGVRDLVTDAQLLLRVLANFVDNAFKYTRRGGVLVSARRRGGRVRLAVWDTGLGIEAADLPRVFEEFYQAGNPHRDSAQGLGIGLAIVRRLAGLLKGEVGLRSVPGRGSVFWIDLPDEAPPRAPVPPGEAAAPSRDPAPSAFGPPSAPLPLPSSDGHARPTVLVLDDERAVCEAMRIWLAPHCAAVHVAQRLDDALALAREHDSTIDALVVDFRLAEPVSGIEAIARLREMIGRAVPAVLVTGDTDPRRVRAAYDSGLAVLFKPVNPRELVRVLARVAETAR